MTPLFKSVIKTTNHMKYMKTILIAMAQLICVIGFFAFTWAAEDFYYSHDPSSFGSDNTFRIWFCLYCSGAFVFIGTQLTNLYKKQ